MNGLRVVRQSLHATIDRFHKIIVIQSTWRKPQIGYGRRQPTYAALAAAGDLYEQASNVRMLCTCNTLFLLRCGSHRSRAALPTHTHLLCSGGSQESKVRSWTDSHIPPHTHASYFTSSRFPQFLLRNLRASSWIVRHTA